ncbi:MAG: hypothetical protein ACWA5W_02460 [Phycisphaerales bacterium]
MDHPLEAFSIVARQWITRALALCVVGPICASLANSLQASDGSGDTTFLSASFAGLTTLLITLMIALIFGIIVSRITDRKEALLDLALVYGWIGWTSGSLGDIFRIEQDSGVLLRLAAESFLISALTLAGLMIIGSGTPKNTQAVDDSIARFDLASFRQDLLSKSGGIALLLSVVAAGIIASLLGQSSLPGQAVGVGFVAGIAGGLAGALGWSGSQKNAKDLRPAPYAILMLGVMLMGILAPLIGILRPGEADLLGLVVKGNLPGLLIVSPIAWSMGALLGVPVGHSWVEHSVQQSTQSAVAA